jgi:uncharacterized protein YndB with AHSA1/START domain
MSLGPQHARPRRPKPRRRKPGRPAGVADEAVKVATGKSWREWFAILDRAGAERMTHKQIVAYVSKRHDVGPWWQQMVTVGYEQAREMRQKHEMPDGFQISRSLTINAPVGRLYDAWNDSETRESWLRADEILIRKATRDRSLRITWTNRTNVEVMFYPKSERRTQVTVQHSKLPNAAIGEKMKKYWGEALARLEAAVRT